MRQVPIGPVVRQVHKHTPFCGHFPPAAIRWWSTVMKRDYTEDYSHHRVLRAMLNGRSAEDTEMLSYCYERVINQRAGHRVTGEWCVCLSENAPSAGVARGEGKSDGFSTLLSLAVDLEHAADALPISWSTTRRVFEAQARGDVWQMRFGRYTSGELVREIDRWLEPRDQETGRLRSASLTFYLMALAVHGARTYCEWPRRQPTPIRAWGPHATTGSRGVPSMGAQLKEAA